MRRFFLQGLLIAVLVVLVGVGFLAWIGTDSGLVPVPPITPSAGDIQDIYVYVGAFATFVFLVVTVPLMLFVVRFRQGKRDRTEEGPQIRGHTRLELMWTAIPVLILVAIAAFVFVKLPNIDTGPAAAAEDAELTVEVQGTQFFWRYVYPNGAVSFDTFRAPVDTKVKMEISAPDWDVIHSWWVPALGGKADAIPGRVNEMSFEAMRTGSFPVKCAELCGIQHAVMLGTAEIMPQDAYATWVESALPAERDDLGQEIFDRVCSKCHFAAPEYAPNIAGNPLLADAEALTQIVREGRGRMPPVGREWTDAEVEALVEFAASLAGGSE